MVLQAYPIPAQGTPDYYAVDLLNQVLSGGESSRLNKRVVEQDQLALYCGAFSFGLEDPGLTWRLPCATWAWIPAKWKVP